MLTIVIPTMNRSDFIIRLLNYYADAGFKYWICIGDSSDAHHVEKTRKAIKNFEGKLKIMYHQDTGKDGVEYLQQMFQSVFTPYTVFIGDDDFLVPNCLEQCVRFLENNKDYNSVHGVGYFFSLDSEGPYGKFLDNYNYRLPLIESEKASQRILEYLKNYSVNMFSLHRTESYKTMFRNVTDLPDKNFSGELLPCCISVIQGKVKQLDCLYLIRQGHSKRISIPLTKKIYENNPNWDLSYNIFIDRLSEELSRQDGITLDESRNIVEKAFKFYLDNLTNSAIFARLGNVARYFPGMGRVIMYFKYKLFAEISLSALLNPSSPYHKDFMPVYNVITKQPKNK